MSCLARGEGGRWDLSGIRGDRGTADDDGDRGLVRCEGEAQTATEEVEGVEKAVSDVRADWQVAAAEGKLEAELTEMVAEFE